MSAESSFLSASSFQPPFSRGMLTDGAQFPPYFALVDWKVDARLPGKGNSNSHGAKPVHAIISMIKWIRTSRLSMNHSLSVARTFLSAGLSLSAESSFPSGSSFPPGGEAAVAAVLLPRATQGQVMDTTSGYEPRTEASGYRSRANTAHVRQSRTDSGRGSFLRFIDSCITQLKAQGPSRTCNETKEEEESRSARLPQSSERGAYETVKALTFRLKSLKRFQLLPLRSESGACGAASFL